MHHHDHEDSKPHTGDFLTLTKIWISFSLFLTQRQELLVVYIYGIKIYIFLMFFCVFMYPSSNHEDSEPSTEVFILRGVYQRPTL